MVKMSKFPYNLSGLVLVCHRQRRATREASARLRPTHTTHLMTLHDQQHTQHLLLTQEYVIHGLQENGHAL